ncbi:hypothetical protein ASD10_04125 [Aeromicrobium sp. Root472D3]|nr:hypothetical protein ASD10_04125 [Aeromicrobium sp. Root472D3]
MRKKEETVGLSEDEIRFGIGALGDIAAFWEALPGGSGPRIVECIQTSTSAQLVEAGALSVTPPDAGVGEEVNVLLGERLKDIEARLLVDALSLRSVPKLVDQAVARIENSGSWSTTNTLMPLMPALVPTLTVQHVKRLCVAATTNYEIYQANSADFEFTRLFELTNEWVGVRNEWIELARFEHPYNNNLPAFPDARAAVIARWGAGVL